MRFFFSGPRIMGIRPGVFFGPEDFRRSAPPSSNFASPQSPSMIYVIRSASSHTKIGVSSNPLARLATLQTGSSSPLELSYVAAVKSGDATRIEQETHATLSRHRLAGEWFDIAPDLAVAAIGAASFRINDPIISIAITDLPYAIAQAEAESISVEPRKRPRPWLWALGFATPWAAVLGVAFRPFGADTASTAAFLAMAIFSYAIMYAIAFLIFLGRR